MMKWAQPRYHRLLDCSSERHDNTINDNAGLLLPPVIKAYALGSKDVEASLCFEKFPSMAHLFNNNNRAITMEKLLMLDGACGCLRQPGKCQGTAAPWLQQQQHQQQK